MSQVAHVRSQRLLEGHQVSKQGHQVKGVKSLSVSGWRMSNVVTMEKAQLWGSGQHECELPAPRLCHQPALWPCKPLGLSFLTCDMDSVIAPAAWGYFEMKRENGGGGLPLWGTT